MIQTTNKSLIKEHNTQYMRESTWLLAASSVRLGGLKNKGIYRRLPAFSALQPNQHSSLTVASGKQTRTSSQRNSIAN
jgi:hypothetical protein